MTALVLDAQTGISGDMTVAALLDLGASREKLLSVLKSLPDQQFEITISRVKKNALDACDFKVKSTSITTKRITDTKSLMIIITIITSTAIFMTSLQSLIKQSLRPMRSLLRRKFSRLWLKPKPKLTVLL